MDSSSRHSVSYKSITRPGLSYKVTRATTNIVPLQARLRETSPSGQASLRRISRQLARMNTQSSSPAGPSTPTPYTRSIRPSRMSDAQPAIHSSSSPFGAKVIVASSEPDPFNTTSMSKKQPGKDSPSAIRAGEMKLSRTLDSFSSMFGGYSPVNNSPSKAPSKAPAKTNKLAAQFTEKVKKGKQPGEARVSVVDLEWTSAKKVKESTARILFPVKEKGKDREMTGMGVGLSSDETMVEDEDGDDTLKFDTLEEMDKMEEDARTPSYASTPSVASSSVASPPQVRGRYNLRGMGGLPAPEKSRKRKRELEIEESPIGPFR